MEITTKVKNKEVATMVTIKALKVQSGIQHMEVGKKYEVGVEIE